MNTGLLVLGMHRSGTSAVAGTLGLLGAEAGSSLMPPHPDINPKGFWENDDIVAVHESILKRLGSSWHDERNLPTLWWQQPELKPMRQELVQIISRGLSHAPLWMVKDPRLCRLLPLWGTILKESALKAKVILIIRHPHEVAESLKQRDGIPHERSYFLWLQHVLDAERFSRGYPRVLITYEQLLSDWRNVVNHIALSLSLPEINKTEQLQKKVDDFLEPGLRHHVVAPENLGGGYLLELAQSVYQAHIEGKDITQLDRTLDPLSKEINVFEKQIHSWSTEIQDISAALTTERGKAYAAENEISRIKSTVSWQLTKPLRLLANLPNRLTRH